MDVVGRFGRLLFNVGWATSELAVALYDIASHRDTDAELKRFIADHPGVIIRRIEEQP